MAKYGVFKLGSSKPLQEFEGDRISSEDGLRVGVYSSVGISDPSTIRPIKLVGVVYLAPGQFIKEL